MIDFRYHVVSLIAVFLALATGVILGSGPLGGTIGDSLHGQVEKLRTEKDQLREQVQAGQADLEHRDAFAQAISPRLISGQLAGRRIVAVRLPGAEDATASSQIKVLQAAGAEVTAQLELTDSWLAADRESARTTVLDRWKSAVPAPNSTAPAENAIAPTARPSSLGLARLLGQAITAKKMDAAQANKIVTDMAAQGLVDLASPWTGAGTMAVVFAPPVTAAAAGADPSVVQAKTDDTRIWAEVLVTMDRSLPIVAVGPASAATKDGILEVIRGDTVSAARISTVDSGATTVGDLVTVWVIRDQLSAGAVGHYGFAGSARAPAPASMAAAG